MQIQGRKRRQGLECMVRGECNGTVRDTCSSGVRDLTARMADELSRVGTRAAAREAKRQMWRLVDYYRALEACYASWIAQTGIDACKLLHVPARAVLSDRTRKDQVESLLHRCLTHAHTKALSCSIAVLTRAWDTHGQVRVVFVPAERLAAAVLEAAPVVRFDA